MWAFRSCLDALHGHWNGKGMGTATPHSCYGYQPTLSLCRGLLRCHSRLLIWAFYAVNPKAGLPLSALTPRKNKTSVEIKVSLLTSEWRASFLQYERCWWNLESKQISSDSLQFLPDARALKKSPHLKMLFFPTAVLLASSTAANSNKCFPCPHQQCVSAFSGIEYQN